MTLLELVWRVRLRLDDFGGDTGPAPAGFTYYWEADDTGALWKNEEIVNYLNAACNELAHRLPIVDSSDQAVNRISLLSGVSRYSIDRRILAIDSVVLESTGQPLVKLSEAKDRSQRADPFDAGFQNPSAVQYYRSDFDELTLTVYATPTLADRLLLAVRRLPLAPLTWANRATDEPEFPAHRHEALIDWACMQALLKRDADTFDSEAAGRFQGLFTDSVGPRVAFRHAEVLKTVAGTRLRTRCYYA